MAKTIEDCLKWNWLYHEKRGTMEALLDALVNGCTECCTRFTICKAFFLSKNNLFSIPGLRGTLGKIEEENEFEVKKMETYDKLVIIGIVQLISMFILVLLVDFPLVWILVLVLSPAIPFGIAGYLDYRETEAKKHRILTPEESRRLVLKERIRKALEQQRDWAEFISILRNNGQIIINALEIIAVAIEQLQSRKEYTGHKVRMEQIKFLQTEIAFVIEQFHMTEQFLLKTIQVKEYDETPRQAGAPQHAKEAAFENLKEDL